MDKKYTIGEVTTQTQEMIIQPDGNPITVPDAIARILNIVDELNKKL